MIWIAWRFQRSVALALGLLALIVVGFVVVTGTMQHHDLVQFLGAPCHGRQLRLQLAGRRDLCGVLDVRLSNIRTYNTFIEAAGLIIAPLVGAILGLLAVASEVDSRTVRLAWTQSISRTRWFAAKVGVGAALVAIILVPTAVVLSWWNGAIGERNLFQPQTCGIAGWDLVAYGLFMFALTVLLGAVIRRAGWTLAVAVLLFLVVAVVVPSRVRMHLVAPKISWSEPYLATKGDFSGVSYSNEPLQSDRILVQVSFRVPPSGYRPGVR